MKLLRFEMVKTFSRWRTYISFGAIALIVVLAECFMSLRSGELLGRILRSFQRDFFIFGNVLNAWFVTALLMNSLHIHIPFLLTLVAGDIVSNESTAGTVRLLLIRPPSRLKILVMKYLTTVIYTAFVVIFFGLLSVMLGMALFGSGDLVTNYHGQFRISLLPETQVPGRMLLAFIAAIWSMMVVSSLAFFFSTIAENSVGPIIGTMAILIVFLVIDNFPFDFFQEIKPYLFTSYMKFWQQFLGGAIPWQDILRSAVVLGVHNLGLFAASMIVYQRKDIKS